MKTIIAIAFIIGMVFNIPCNEVKPKESDDCLSVYLPDAICCMRTIIEGDSKTVTCEEKDISYSYKSQFSTTKQNGVAKSDSLNCRIKVDLCGPMTARKAKQCNSAILPNGQCCFDKKQKVCFSYPFHYKSEDNICGELPKPKDPVEPENPSKPTKPIDPSKPVEWPIWIRK